jgi:glycerol-3-phosphate dehydrogenase
MHLFTLKISRHSAQPKFVRYHDSHRDAAGWAAEPEDQVYGQTFTACTRTVVNAAGPWVQEIPNSGVKLRLTKGIHIVVDRKRLPVSDVVVMVEGKRILFVIPRGDRVIVGVTDTDFHANPEDVAVKAEDVSYVLNAVNQNFPTAALTATDVMSSWAGLRPLIANPNGSPSDISRAHEIRQPHPDWRDMVGGKLTTYRLMVEQTVDQIVCYLAKPVIRCRTTGEPLLPSEENTLFSGILPAPFTRKAVEHFVRNEWAVFLEDVLVRRSGWHYYRHDAAACADADAYWVADIALWSPTKRLEEITAYRAG